MPRRSAPGLAESIFYTFKGNEVPPSDPPTIRHSSRGKQCGPMGFFMRKVSRVSCYRDDPVPNRITVSFGARGCGDCRLIRIFRLTRELH